MPAELAFRFRPRNEAQAAAAELWARSRILYLGGAAGTGKTFLALAFAVAEAIAGRCKKITLCRPLVECGGEKIGFLPGELADKLGPWMAPFRDVAENCVAGKNPWLALTKLLADRGCEVEPVPIGYLRGRNVKGILIVDEAQNLNASQVFCVLTRVCAGGRAILCGDRDQSDLAGPCAADAAFSKLADLDTVTRFDFRPADVVRDPLVGQIVARLAPSLDGDFAVSPTPRPRRRAS